MSEIRVHENESLESALRRFKRLTARSGILAEARKREHYEKPSVKRKKKAEDARKRKYCFLSYAPLHIHVKGRVFWKRVPAIRIVSQSVCSRRKNVSGRFRFVFSLFNITSNHFFIFLPHTEDKWITVICTEKPACN